MRIDASKLEWHDAGVDGTNYEDGTRTMQWKIEVFRWDIGDRGDAQPGLLMKESNPSSLIMI